MNRSEKKHVLIIDDDRDMREVIVEALESNGYGATAVADGESMWKMLSRKAYDLLLMDLKLGKENGLHLACEVRKDSAIPIMMLTGIGDETDRILGLELVADDFLMKPFNIRELLARVRALIRRNTELNQPSGTIAGGEHDLLKFGAWTLDVTARELRNESGKTVELTLAEFNLLESMLKAPDRVLSREQLIEKSRSIESDVFDRTIDVLILRLRRKIESNPKAPRYIVTERGVGYMLVGPVTAR